VPGNVVGTPVAPCPVFEYPNELVGEGGQQAGKVAHRSVSDTKDPIWMRMSRVIYRRMARIPVWIPYVIFLPILMTTAYMVGANSVVAGGRAGGISCAVGVLCAYAWWGFRHLGGGDE
jgi:hypothetical protein